MFVEAYANKKISSCRKKKKKKVSHNHCNLSIYVVIIHILILSNKSYILIYVCMGVIICFTLFLMI